MVRVEDNNKVRKMHYTEEDIRKVWDSDMSEAEKKACHCRNGPFHNGSE